jgi:hypothetical protein
MRWRGEGCFIFGPNGAPLFGAGPYSRSNIPFPSFSRAHAGRRACATWPRKRFLLGAEQYSGSTGVTACVCRAICPSFTPPPSVSLCAHAVGPRSGRRVWRHPPTQNRHGAGCSLITTGNCGNFTPPTYCCARNSRCCQTAAALYYCCVSNLGFVYRVMIWVLISNAFRSPPT